MSNITNLIITKAEYDEIEIISKLAQSIYLKYLSQSESKEGVETFLKYSSKEEMESRYTKDGSLLVVAKINNSVVGMMEMKNKNHISLCFVDDRYFRNKIASKLFFHVKEILGDTQYTVNSTPKAVSFYESIGFQRLSDDIKESDGIQFIPMIY